MVPSPRKLAYTIVSCSGEVRIYACLQYSLSTDPVLQSTLCDSAGVRALDVLTECARDEVSATISQDVLTAVAGSGTSSISTSLR